MCEQDYPIKEYYKIEMLNNNYQNSNCEYLQYRAR